jgi:hemin uptake protein HemP
MRKVLEANFHQAIFIKRIGELGRTLSSETNFQGTKTMKVEMETDGNALYLKIERAGIKVDAMVPGANVVAMVLASEEAK